ncbi:S8 family serine peptidase [Mycoplasma sp. VS299A]|uniref:S8 family serine peptidase n=1 Tax=Mycoplasma sp. VS299A TaxID=3401690 RepID=UPI003AAA262A
MKKIKKILTLICSSSIAAITVATTLSASLEKDVKINKYSDLTLSTSELSSIKNIYKHYFNLHEIDKSLITDDYNLNDSYSKVGIIEINGLKKTDIINTKTNADNFHVHGGFVSENSKTTTWHGSKVYSLIGADLGVNENANVFYSSFDMINQSGISNAEKQKILSKYPDIEWNVYSQLKNSLDYMVENGVKVVNLSLGIKFLVNSLSKKSLNTLNEIENYFINYKSSSDSENITSPLEDLYWLKNISHIMQNDLSNNPKLDEILDFYNKKYGIVAIVAAGNDGEIYKKLKDHIKSLTNYKDLKDLYRKAAQELMRKSAMNGLLSTDYTRLQISEKLLDELSYDVVENGNRLENIMSTLKLNPEKKYKAVIDKFTEILKTTIGNNVIYVASVGEKMRPSEFSTFAMFENDNLPLVSSYGESIKTDTNSRQYPKDSNLNSLIKYYYNSQGTSFSAPIITGMISLLQQIFHRTFTLSEIKALLAYSSQIYDYNLNMYTDSGYDYEWYIKNSHRYGVRRKNNSFSKIGFGVPSFRKMYNVIKNNKLKKINVTANNFDNDNEKFEFSSNSYSYQSSSRYTMVVAYDNINPVNDKNGFLWYLANKKDISEKYWDFLMYCTKNLKNQDILNLNAMFSYHIYYQNWFDYYDYYPEETSKTTHSVSNSNTSSVEKVWIDMPVYGQDDEMYMDDYEGYISFIYLKALKEVYDNYANQKIEIDEKISWEECKEIFAEYINSLDITYIINTDYIDAKRGDF